MCTSAAAGPVGVRLSDIRAHIEHYKGRYTAMCARTSEVPTKVSLTVKATRSLELESVIAATTSRRSLVIEATTDDAFSECFAREVAADPPWSYVHESYSGTIDVVLDRPQKILSRALDEWLREEDGCRPHAGAIPRSMTVDITSDDVEMVVKVAITPANASLEACELASVNALLLEARIDTGVWKPTAHVRRALRPIMTNASLREATAFYAPHAVASCIAGEVAASIDEAVMEGKKPPRLGTMAVAVTAKLDAADVVVAARSGDKTRDACTEAALTKLLHVHIERRYGDGTSFFRIDGSAAARLRFPIETQGQLDARDSAERAKLRARIR